MFSSKAMQIDIKKDEEKPKKVLKIKKLSNKFEKPLTREEVIEQFLLVPGITKDYAELLYDNGITSLSELFYNVLPEKTGFNKNTEYTCKIMEDKIMFDKKGVNTTVTCPRCKTVFPISDKKCKVCGADLEEDIIKINEKNLLDLALGFVKEIAKYKEEGDSIDLSVKDIDEVKTEPVKLDIDMVIDELKQQTEIPEKNMNISQNVIEGKDTSSKEQDKTPKKEPVTASFFETFKKTSLSNNSVPVYSKTDTSIQNPQSGMSSAPVYERKYISKQEEKKIDTDEVLKKYVDNKMAEFEKEVREVFNEVKANGASWSSYLRLLKIYKDEGFDIVPLYRLLKSNIKLFEEQAPNMIITQYRKKLEKMVF
ncbi:MAG: hypothetical protein ACP5RS_02840 [Thermoplasmata archaeon]